MPGALAKKLGMTHVYNDHNRHIPVTVLELYPQTVTAIRSNDKDGYVAIQIGAQVSKRLNAPQQKELSKNKIEIPANRRREVAWDEQLEVKIGQTIDVTLFSPGDKLKATGTSKGKGYAGVIKRHGFSRGPETHGSEHHREPGSIGSMFPQHVVKGRRMPGHMGNDAVTVRKVEVVAINPTNNTIAVKGPLPGANRGMILLEKMG